MGELLLTSVQVLIEPPSSHFDHVSFERPSCPNKLLPNVHKLCLPLSECSVSTTVCQFPHAIPLTRTIADPVTLDMSICWGV